MVVEAKQYLLDTTACIAVIRGKLSVIGKIKSVGLKNCKVSEISIAELYYGASKSGQEKLFDDVKTILQMFKVIPVFPSLPTYGEVKAHLETIGQRIDDMDLLIGSTALHNNMTLVTHNIKHLSRLPNVDIQDWEM